MQNLFPMTTQPNPEGTETMPKTFYMTRGTVQGVFDTNTSYRVFVHMKGRLRRDGLPYLPDRRMAIRADFLARTTGITFKPGETKRVQLREVKP